MATGDFVIAGDHGIMEYNDEEWPVVNWRINPAGNMRNLTNARDGRWRTGGLPDASGSFELPVDRALPPVVPNTIVTLKMYHSVDDDQFYQVTAILGDPSVTDTFDGEGALTVPWALQSGVLTYPSYA